MTTPLPLVTDEALAEAAILLARGALVAFPTETVYGLGADATNGRAVAQIFAAKGRPTFNPLIIHVATIEAAHRLGIFSPLAEQLAAEFWPGALTLIVRRSPDCPVSELATCGLRTIALRMPSHPLARALLKRAGVPVAAPSANRSGHVSATRADHVAADLGDAVAMIIDGAATPLGIESTVLDVSGSEPTLLRPGGVTREAIEQVLGRPLVIAAPESTAAPISPGQLTSHYAPSAHLRLAATSVRPGEALLAFGADVPAHGGPMLNLSPSGDLAEAASNLFSALRALDADGADVIAVMPVPEQGLGAAINDRLRRAAAPRPS